MSEAITLLDHQKEALELLRKHKAYALWDDVGAGKTYPIIFRMLESLLANRKKWIVIAEVQLLDQWKEEIERVCGDLGITSGIITGDSTKGQRAVMRVHTPDVIITNYEYFPKLEEWLIQLAARGDISGIVCDEAHRMRGFRGFRGSGSMRAKSIIRVAHVHKGTDKEIARIMASGSPLVNPESAELWGLYYFLEPEIYGPVLWKFEVEFFYNVVKGQPFQKLVLRPGMKEEMSRRMYLIARRKLLGELGVPLPEKRPIKYTADMSPKLAEMYASLQAEAMLQHEGEIIARPVLLARLMALQQLASGFIIDRPAGEFSPDLFDTPDGNPLRPAVVHHIDSSHKDKILWDIIDNIGRDKHVVIWAHFKHELAHITKMLKSEGLPVACAWSDIPSDEKRQGIIDFKAGKKTHLVAQPASAGAGLNLQICGHSVRYSRSHRLIDYIQSNGRTYRINSLQFHPHVTSHDIVTKHTRDELVYRRLIEQRDLSSEITLDDFKEKRNA